MRGFMFPLNITNKSLDESSPVNENLPSGIGERIKMLIKTGRNSRPFSGDYGIGLQAVFSMLGGKTDSFQRDIMESINSFIKEVDLTPNNIKITTTNNVISVEIEYRDRDLQLLIEYAIF